MNAHSGEETARRRHAAERIVLQYLRSVAAGEHVNPQDVLAQNPDLHEELSAEFRRQNLIDTGKAAAGQPAPGSSSSEQSAPPQANIRATMIESDEEPEGADVRQTLYCHWGESNVHPMLGLGEIMRPDGKPVMEKTQRFRPKLRPPMALLVIVDDNQSTGEWIRIRESLFAIGRSEGNVMIPHEMLMSRRHAEIRLQREGEGYAWYLHDLQSTNGTFVLVDAVRPKAGDEFLIGSRKFRFEIVPDPYRRPTKDTAVLVELLTAGTGQRIEARDAEVLIGRDPKRCPAFLADDPLLEPEHARFYREPGTGRWCVRRLQSNEGIWARVPRVRLRHGCWFQLGEQRFRFLLP